MLYDLYFINLAHYSIRHCRCQVCCLSLLLAILCHSSALLGAVEAGGMIYKGERSELPVISKSMITPLRPVDQTMKHLP